MFVCVVWRRYYLWFLERGREDLPIIDDEYKAAVNFLTPRLK